MAVLRSDAPTLVVDGATFRFTRLGSWALIQEAGDEATTTNHAAMAAVCLLVGSVSTVAVAVATARSTARPAHSGKRRALVALTLANIVAHTWHYVDNIVRPADYLEPLFLYRARLWTSMEVTFTTLLLLSPLGVYGYTAVMRSWPAEGAALAGEAARRRATDWKRGWLLLLGYAALSAVAGGHYAVELPPAYAWDVNGSITTETVCAVALGVWACAELRNVARLRQAEAAPAATDSSDEEAGSSSSGGSGSDASGGDGGTTEEGAGTGSGGSEGRSRDRVQRLGLRERSRERR